MKKQPDPHALKIAGAAQAAVDPDIVILFGSRAAGDHRENSDVDLMVVADHENHRTSRGLAEMAAQDYMRKNPPELELGMFSMTRMEFDRHRRANQHIAGQAANHGVNMSGERLDYRYNDDDEYPTHWRTTRERIQTAEQKMMEFQIDVENDHWNQGRTGHGAEQALENALKGLLSANNERGRFRHDIPRAWLSLRQVEEWATHEEQQVRDSVQDLLDHTTFISPVPGYPNRTLNWLVLYATEYDNSGSSHIMSREEQHILLEKTRSAVENLIRLTHIRSGTRVEDVWVDGVHPWERPLG